MINPQTPEAAREVLEKEIRSLIVANFTPSTPDTPAKLNATKASKEISDLFVEAWTIAVNKRKAQKIQES